MKLLLVLLLLVVGCKRPQTYSEDADGVLKPNKPRARDLRSASPF
jgi:hypothetical protein